MHHMDSFLLGACSAPHILPQLSIYSPEHQLPGSVCVLVVARKRHVLLE